MDDPSLAAGDPPPPKWMALAPLTTRATSAASPGSTTIATTILSRLRDGAEEEEEAAWSVEEVATIPGQRPSRGRRDGHIRGGGRGEAYTCELTWCVWTTFYIFPSWFVIHAGDCWTKKSWRADSVSVKGQQICILEVFRHMVTSATAEGKWKKDSRIKEGFYLICGNKLRNLDLICGKKFCGQKKYCT